jgi:hypothetical protein
MDKQASTPEHFKAFVAVALRGDYVVAAGVESTLGAAIAEVVKDKEYDFVSDRILTGFLTEYFEWPK